MHALYCMAWHALLERLRQAIDINHSVWHADHALCMEYVRACPILYAMARLYVAFVVPAMAHSARDGMQVVADYEKGEAEGIVAYDMQVMGWSCNLRCAGRDSMPLTVPTHCILCYTACEAMHCTACEAMHCTACEAMHCTACEAMHCTVCRAMHHTVVYRIYVCTETSKLSSCVL